MKHGTLKSKEWVYCLVLSLFFIFCSISGSAAVTYCAASAFGYGHEATGGGSATPVLVSSVSQLQSALNKAKNKVIIITQDLTFTSMLSVQDGQNVTLLGLPGVTLTSLQQTSSSSGILYVKRFNNLIIRNLTFVGPGAYDCDGNDLLCFESVTKAWVDHCDFQDGCDGNFDNKKLSDNVTISWCRFRYLKAPKAGGSGGSDDHRFTNLLGSSSSDKPSDGTYNYTWAYCWWDNGCKERMVRCRNAELHFLNCYWNSSVANYYVGPENAKAYFEGCTFEGKANTKDKIFKSYGGTNACKFVDCSGNLPSNSGTVSAPSYSYTASGRAEAKTAVTNATCGAGATLTVTTAGAISSTCDGGTPAPTVYVVTWDATTNGGACGTATSLVTDGNAVGSLPEATKDGYTFDGWFTKASGGTKISSSTTITANVTYYAQFTETVGPPAPEVYTVIWDANGGTCATASTEVESGNAIGTLPEATKEGDYDFDGWYTAVNGGTKILTTTTVTGNVTYYAHYVATGGGGGGGCETLAQGTQNAAHTAIDATVGTITTTGGEAQDGYIKLSGSSSQCFVVTAKSGYTIAAGDKLTVTVYNKANSAADIGFTINGTAHTKSVAAKTEDQVVYELASTDISAGTVTIKRNESNDRYGAILLERCGATPPPASYTLSYDENGGSGTMTDDTGTDVTVKACTFTAPTGYSFMQWNTDMNGGGTTKTAGDAITLTEDMTLYAIWQPNTYTVTLNAEGGSGGSANVTATFDAAMPDITIPTQTGYIFKGYFTGTNGTGTQYYDENGSSTNNWTIDSDTELHAYWVSGSVGPIAGCDLHFWFFASADAETNGKTNDGTVFSAMVSDGSNMSGNITIDGTSYSVTRRTGDNATFGSFTIPSGYTGVFYALAVSSGSGDRQINLVGATQTYELDVPGGSDSYKRLESGELPAGTYSIQREGSSNVRLGMVAVKLCTAAPASDAPTISVQPTGAVYCAGAVVSALSVTASGSGTVTYQWKKDGVDIDGAEAATYTPIETGTFACAVTNEETGKSPTALLSDEAEVTINAAIAAPTCSQTENTVSLTTATIGATIYYTTDGTDPTTLSASGTSVTIVASCTVKAYAVKDGCESTITSFAATYDPSACTEPALMTNEIARFFVPCGLANATSGTAWNVTDVAASTGMNTFSTNKFGGSSSNWYTNTTSKWIYGKLTADDSYIQIKLNTGDFQEGDRVYLYVNRSNATKTGVKLHSTSGHAVTPASTASDVEAEGVYTLVDGDIEADGSLKFFRAGSSTSVNRIIVIRPVTYSITYDCDGAESGCPSNVAAATNLPDPLPTAPVKSGFDFAGWFTNSEKTIAAVAGAELTGNVTLYAKWTAELPVPTFVWDYASAVDVGASYPISVTSPQGVTITLTLLDDPVPVGITTHITGNSGTYDVAGSFVGSTLTFQASSPAEGGYAAHVETKTIDVTTCFADNILYIASAQIDAGKSSKPQKYYEQTGVGRICKDYGSSLSNSSASVTIEGVSFTRVTATLNTLLINPYIDNVVKLRLYVKGGGSSRTLTGLYYAPNYFSSKDDATNITAGSTVVYESGTSFGSSPTYIDVVPSNVLHSRDYLCVTFNNSVNIYGVDFVTTGGTNPSTMVWNIPAPSNPVSVTEGDNGFTYNATVTGMPHSLGTISYSSSDPEVASVNATTGEVTILDHGSAIISAILSASGCYKEMSISYRVEVQECKDDPCVISSPKTEKCPGESVTLTVADCEESATIQWYKDGVLLPGETGMTMTTDQAGAYKAVATKNCHQHSNVITLTDLTAAATITANFDYYYIKNNLSTFHSINIPLFEVMNADGISANFDVTTIGCTLVLEDGKVYLRGQPSIAANNTINPFTVTVTNSCNSTAANATMELRLLAATAQPTVAWVVIGTEGGDFTEGITSGQGSGNQLFDYLNTHGYSLTAVNDYATTNERAIEQYYSQYDLIVMTDYPNSKQKDGSGKSYTNAVGSLLDKKPMLSMEAFVSAQPNWRISSDPYNPSPKQKTMKLLCAAHQIFDPAVEIGVYTSGGEEYVDVLASLSGSRTLQGFSPVSIPDFIFIATIHDDVHGELITCCERQTEIKARLMILGIESSGMNYMNDGSKQMVKQILDYLLIADPTMIADCSLVFDNGNDGAITGGGDHLWSNPYNWGPNHGSQIPTPYHAVRIERPCKVDIANAHASSARIAKGTYLEKTYNGSIEVLPKGALSLTGFMKRTYNNDFLTRHPLEPGDITVRADEYHNGALIWGDASGEVPATVEMYSTANGATSANPVWQYIGSPFASRMTAIEQYYKAWMCRWSYISSPQLGGTWTWVYNEDRIDPFVGYTITQEAAMKYAWTGTLNNPEEKVLPLRYTADADGFAMFANSWVAPINIGAMEAGDFDGADPTIYIFNTGTYAQYEAGGAPGDATVEDKTGAGQYTAVPVNSAPYVGMSTIPPMQGFFVQTTRNGNLTLDYKKIVMDTVNFESTTTPMRAPQRVAEEPTDKIIPEVMRLAVESEQWGDKVFLLAHSEFSEAYELGWEGRKQEGDERAPYIAAYEPAGAMSVAAVNDFEGRELIFRAGADSIYTFRFDYNGETIYLYDRLADQATEIRTGNTYSFEATNKTPMPRFLITKNPPRMPTDIGSLESESLEFRGAQKMIIDGMLFILRDNRFYDARGVRVTELNRKEGAR